MNIFNPYGGGGVPDHVTTNLYCHLVGICIIWTQMLIKLTCELLDKDYLLLAELFKFWINRTDKFGEHDIHLLPIVSSSDIINSGIRHLWKAKSLCRHPGWSLSKSKTESPPRILCLNDKRHTGLKRSLTTKRSKWLCQRKSYSGREPFVNLITDTFLPRKEENYFML